METSISSLVEQYESGNLTRRQLVAGLGTLVAVLGGSGQLLAAQDTDKPASTFEGVGLNHIALNVPDIAKSRDFYIKHLGLTVSRESANNCFLTAGKNFVALFRNEKPGMNHYCYAIKNFDVEVARKKLEAEGFTPRVEGQRIYFPDPDGLEVQLAAENHRAT